MDHNCLECGERAEDAKAQRAQRIFLITSALSAPLRPPRIFQTGKIMHGYSLLLLTPLSWNFQVRVMCRISTSARMSAGNGG